MKDDKSLAEMMEKIQEMWQYICLAHSVDLLDSDEFKDQKYIDLICLTGFRDYQGLHCSNQRRKWL